jgi:hypothetical protein
MKNTQTIDDQARLTATVESFCAGIESLPARDLRSREWGPREVLAHLVYWHEGYVRRTSAVRTGQSPTLPQGRFADINACAVANLRDVPIRRMIQRLRAANRRLCTLAAAHDPRRIAFRIKQDSHPWRLSDLIPAAEAHIRHHLRTLKKEFPGG